MSGPLGSSQWMYASGGYEIEQSLRFDDARETNLKYVPETSGNRRTFTFSCWTKRANLGAETRLFGCYQANDSPWSFKWHSDDRLTLDDWASPQIMTVQKYRDTSAWYHLLIAWDTT